MKNTFFISGLVALFVTSNLFGQQSSVNSTDSSKVRTETNNQSSIIKAPRLKYSMELGAGYFGASKLFSGTYTSIAPSINYLVSPKLNIEVGGVFMTGNTNFSQNSILKTNPSLAQNSNQYFVFANSQYALSKRLMLTGSFYSTLNSNKTPQINPYFLDYKGMNVGLNHKITNNMSIGAEFRMTNTPYNYFYDPAGFGSFRSFQGNRLGW